MSNHALTPHTTHDDGRNIRTALVIDASAEDQGSIALVRPDGTLLALVNVFHYPVFHKGQVAPEHVIIDVIDKDDAWPVRQTLTFVDGQRQFHDASKVTSVDFRKETT